ncbi:MAG: amidohydrolase family protein [Deltaproteobacteria bacterium]|nr:amidohydrolase family protein [Deltaproteobacteria bacterium]
MTMQTDFYDAHVHFLWCGSFETVRHSWQALIDKGLTGIAGIIKVNPPPDPQKFLEFIPVSYHNQVDSSFFAEGLGAKVSTAERLGDVEVFPYLDCRFIEARDADLTGFQRTGFRGLKVLYLPEEDAGMGIVGWEKFFGRSESESQALIVRMVDQAVSFGWPIIFHANLNEYGDFTIDILQAHKGHPFIIPHFGFSRRIMATFLERLDNCYSDFSSLLPFMRKDPQKYLEFITTFQDRILFGTDATLGQPGLIAEYADFIIHLIRDEETRNKIMIDNYRHFHRLLLQSSVAPQGL